MFNPTKRYELAKNIYEFEMEVDESSTFLTINEITEL